jgi:hypothetical protein
VQYFPDDLYVMFCIRSVVFSNSIYPWSSLWQLCSTKAVVYACKAAIRVHTLILRKLNVENLNCSTMWESRVIKSWHKHFQSEVLKRLKIADICSVYLTTFSVA